MDNSDLRICLTCGKAYHDLSWLDKRCGHCSSADTKPFAFQLCFLSTPILAIEYIYTTQDGDIKRKMVNRAVYEAQRTRTFLYDMFGVPQFKWHGMVKINNRNVVVEGWTSNPHGHPNAWFTVGDTNLEIGS